MGAALYKMPDKGVFLRETGNIRLYTQTVKTYYSTYCPLHNRASATYRLPWCTATAKQKSPLLPWFFFFFFYIYFLLNLHVQIIGNNIVCMNMYVGTHIYITYVYNDQNSQQHCGPGCSRTTTRRKMNYMYTSDDFITNGPEPLRGWWQGRHSRVILLKVKHQM